MSTSEFSVKMTEESSNNLDLLNLTSLTSLPINFTSNPDTILSILKNRFLEGIHYTSLSSSILLSVNPFNQDQARNSDQVLNEWREEFSDCGKEGVKNTLSNHLWSSSNKAYYYMKRTGQDQSILVT